MNSSHQTKYLETTKEGKEKSPITASAIQKLARKGGVNRLKGDTYKLAREYIILFLEDILRRSYVYNDFRHRTKLEATSVILGLRSSKYNIKLVAGSAATSDARGNLIKMGGGGAKPSESVLREIKKLQKSISTIIPKQTFERLCRNIVLKYLKKDKKNIMFKPDALLVLHDAVESHIIKIFESAQLAAAHAKRFTTEANDMTIVNSFL
jgi:histone H3/H4